MVMVKNAWLFRFALMICCATSLPVWAIDSDGDGFDNALDAFPANASLPKQLSSGSYAFSGGYSNAISAGDVDNDGYADLIMGKAWDNGDSQNHGGIVRVISGKQRKLLYTYNHATGGFGDVGAVGDVNNDGYSDFATIAFSENHNGYYKGAIWIYDGKTGGLLRTYYGDDFGVNYLRRVAALGDVNHDGYDDFALASAAGGSGNCYGGGNGIVAIINGQTGSTLRTIGDACSPIPSNAGDTNADGYPDLLIGEHTTPNGVGRARIFSGKDGALLYTFNGSANWDYFGATARGAGDVNKDGYADIVVGTGSQFVSNSKVFSGKDGALLYAFPSQYNMVVSDTGDVNNDGYADVAIGEYSIGMVKVFSGNNGSILQTFRAQGISGVSNAGDVNGDGKSDLIINSLLGNGTSKPNFTSYVVSLLMDSDGDGIPDAEDNFPLDARHIGKDTDHDNIDDADDADDDNDAISDSNEINLYKTDPLKKDTDNDGMPDGIEVKHSHDPVQADYQISVGGDASCALINSVVQCWGDNTYGQTSVPALSQPKQVSTGKNHVCALHSGGLKCWGNNSKGQTIPPALSNPFIISTGNQFSCALDANGAHCWGDNSSGQLNVPGLLDPVQISSGDSHTCVLDGSGVHCWGDNSYKQLDVPVLTNPVKISAGGRYSCAIDDGGLKCWGTQGDTFGDAEAANPADLIAPSQISAGNKHACALAEKGFKCWGDNNKLQINAPLIALDSDLDGTLDSADAFPQNDAASVDIDHNGVPDNWNMPNSYGCTANSMTCNGLSMAPDNIVWPLNNSYKGSAVNEKSLTL